MPEERIWFSDEAGRKVNGLLARPAGAAQTISSSVAVLCHGFSSNKDSSTNRALTQELVSRGVAAFRFDFFGHGESEGEFADLTLTAAIHDLEQALVVVRARGFSTIGLVGSSFGGIIAAIVAARTPDLRVLALKCPVSDYPAVWRLRLDEAGLAAWRDSGVLAYDFEGESCRLHYTFYDDLLQYDTYALAGTITAPTMIVHGDADEYVPCNHSRRLVTALPQSVEKRLEIVPGADHAFSRPDDFLVMTRLISDWLVARLHV